jgi:hypothetical protein
MFHDNQGNPVGPIDIAESLMHPEFVCTILVQRRKIKTEL